MPGLSPPEGDMASEPLPPLPGMPGLEPGSADKTMPELSLLPPAPLGGARADPTSPGPPRPVPFLPEPESPEPEPVEGGGGMMLVARRPPLPELPEFLLLEPEAVPEPTEGGGGTIPEGPMEDPAKFLDEDPEPPGDVLVPDTEGGGGITFEDWD